MTKFEAIAYDVDGTLVNSFPKHAEAEVLAARRFGVNTDVFNWSDFIGLNRQSLWRQIGRETTVSWQEFDGLTDKIFDTILSNPLDPLIPIDGAIDFLKHARRHIGVSCQITNGVRNNLDSINEELGWNGLFDMTVAYGESGLPKPSPDPYRTVYSRLGIAPEKTIAVEDSITGIISARSAGIFTVAIASYLEYTELKTTDANLVVYDYSHLAFWLSNL